jgi:hypothetical protein
MYLKINIAQSALYTTVSPPLKCIIKRLYNTLRDIWNRIFQKTPPNPPLPLQYSQIKVVSSARTKGLTIINSTANNSPFIANILLKDAIQISKEDRGMAIMNAADQNNLNTVKLLLSSGEISEEDRGFAVMNAAFRGHFNIVQHLLITGKIPEKEKLLAIRNAIHNKHFDIADLLFD